MRGFMVDGVLLLKSNKKYVLTFNILAQVLVITISIIQSRIGQAINSYNNIHQVPSLRDIMAS
jgi:hypothetical protein